MREQTIGEHLDRLASPDIRVRGSAAALQAAQAAALIERSAALALHTTDAEETMRAARAEAGRMRERAMRVGHAEAFAHGHPPAEDDVEVPLRIAALAADLIRLAGVVRDGADDDVLPYLAAAAAGARGALEASAAWVRQSSPGDGSDKEIRARLDRHLAAVPYAEDMVDRAGHAAG
ncbi:hypothetical protein [Streptomyces sp. SID3343]|uniref:hypothetical protein n=1 Tax=Streptomyces sp. SID3343 TaxID=2690260 RepID=UPI00136DDCCD|nr:hypothetical protein [Streptomyces sp. SID3343]MYW05982.1 hypothetical protein [Streptomyces sp. SID3343]